MLLYFLEELKKISNKYPVTKSIVSSVKDIKLKYLKELNKLPLLVTLNNNIPLHYAIKNLDLNMINELIINGAERIFHSANNEVINK